MTKTDIDALTTLRDRVAAAKGADRELDAALFDAFENMVPESKAWPFAAGSGWDKAVPRYCTSLDAAVALVERVLPGWDHGHKSCGADMSFGFVWEHGWHDDTFVTGESATPPLALVHAMLTALIAKETARD